MDGSGTADDPYHLRTVADLEILSGEGYVPYRGSTVEFALENDIDFEGASFTPIATASYAFNGRFNGNGHTISNMVISVDHVNAGFFRLVGGRAFIHDLKFKDCSVTTSAAGYVGMLAGRIYASTYTTITRVETYNCQVTCDGSYGGVGGIVGWACNNGTEGSASTYRTYIYGCSVVGGCVIGTKTVGGIAGYGNYTSDEDRREHLFAISDCRVARVYIRGNTSSSDCFAGGIIGYSGQEASQTYIQHCVVEDSAIVAAGYVAGGVVGNDGYDIHTYLTDCKVYNCLIYAVSRMAGGLVGYHNGCEISIESCTVDCCTIRGGQQIGGFFGRLNEYTTEGAEGNWDINNSSITHNYIGGSSATTAAVGGWVGYIKTGTATGTITNCTQDCNNVSGSLGTYGRNVDGYTNQVVNAAAYVTADSFNCGMLGRKVKFTFVNRRGCSIAYFSDTSTVDTRFRFDTRGAGTYVASWYLWYKYASMYAGNTYTPQIVLRCHGYTGATLTSTNSITIGTRHFISNHDRSFYQKAPDMSGMSNHDQSYVRGEV